MTINVFGGLSGGLFGGGSHGDSAPASWVVNASGVPCYTNSTNWCGWKLNSGGQPSCAATGEQYDWHLDKAGLPVWNNSGNLCGWKFNTEGQPCHLVTGTPFNWSFDQKGYPCQTGSWTPVKCPDGIVQGTAFGDLIDFNYVGDPQGDQIDHNDALLTGEAPQDDIVEGGAGNDTILSGLGNDDVYGGTGDDSIYGGDGDDILRGEDGNDRIWGDNGTDVIQGGNGNDTLSGGAGNDAIDGGTGNDLMSGGDGNDTLSGGANDDVMSGDLGDDRLYGGDGNDAITGNDGVDLIAGGNGNDTLSGGTGNDVIYGDNNGVAAGSPVSFTINGQSSAYINQVFAYTIDPVTGAISNIQTLTVNEDISVGKTYSYVAAPGSVVGVGIISPEGTFYSSGYGSRIGLNGDNAVHTKGLGVNPDGTVNLGFEDLKNLGDKDFNDVTIKIDLGTSGVRFDNAHYNYSSPGVNNPGTGNDLIAGDDGNDTVFGGAGYDTINGGTGSDSLSGGDDRDLFIGGAGDAVDGNEGGDDYDTLDLRGLGRVGIAYDPLNHENGLVTFLDSSGNPTGSLSFKNIENILADNPRDGIVDGTAGNDVIDTAYLGDPQGDRIDANDAILPGEAPQDDIVKAGAGNDLVKAGLGNDDVYGGTGNDTLFGGDGNDLLLGEDGNDLLNGDLGNDTLLGAAGDDTFALNDGFGSDSIVGGETGEVNGDTINMGGLATGVTVNLTGNEAGTAPTPHPQRS